jgi:hypothetical protein
LVYWEINRISSNMKYFAISLALASMLSAAEFRTGQAARALIGQRTFTQQGATASPATLGAVSGVAYANDTLILVDSSRVPAFPQNNRVLVYRNISGKIPDSKASIPLTEARCPVCEAQADIVIGQPDFAKTDLGLAQNRLRTPTSVATDGRVLAVADTDNNRVLIWNSIPDSIDVPADVVIGQKDFTSGALNYGGDGNLPSAQGLRGPQGVWIQGGRLYVADTQNHRVLMWNSIPTQNGQNADMVLGQENFNAFVQPDLTQLRVSATAASMLNPTSVTSDGQRLYVTDLGHNRVMVWNSIPTRNTQPADFVLGQPDVTSTEAQSASDANNSRFLCPSNGTDANGNPTYPYACAATLSFPRYALSDGKRLFIADGGNDRVLVYNSIPTRSGQPADAILGQLTENLVQDSGDLRVSSSDSMRTPSALAWDGSNLYVTDPFNRRVLLFTIGEEALPYTGVRNAASRDIFAVGAVTFSADPKENDEVTIRIADARDYKYKATANQTISNVITGLVEAINAGAGDPDVFASPNPLFNQIILTAKASGDAGNSVVFSVTVSTGAQIQAAASGAALNGGQDAAKIAPGTLVSILGDNLAEGTAVASTEGNDLPRKLAGVEVYIDGMAAPLMYVSPTQINTQLPFEVNDASSVSAWVRIERKDGTVQITNAIGVPVIPQNPGIFADEGNDPRPAVAYHGSNVAIGVVSVDGTPKENDVVSITIGEDRKYSYTVKKDDTLALIRDGLIAEINNNPDELVTATPAAVFTRVVLRAKTPGDEGEGLQYAATGTESVLLTPLTTTLCCASEEGSRITEDNPAVPGETIVVYATGLGLVQPDEAKFSTVTGSKYFGPALNAPNAPVDAIAGGKTANVLYAGMKPGTVGVYELVLLLNSDIPTNPQTQMTIAQDIYVSNIVTFPVVNPLEIPAEP